MTWIWIARFFGFGFIPLCLALRRLLFILGAVAEIAPNIRLNASGALNEGR